VSNKQVLICGGGPGGLAAALLFHQRGWKDIVVIERHAAEKFERGKAFNYQLDGRGQSVLEDLGIHTDTLERYGLANSSFTLTSFKPDGKTKSVTPPILVPDRKVSYWMVRENLLTMLKKELEKRNTDGRIKLLYEHSFRSFNETQDGITTALVDAPNEATLEFTPELLLGCDGLNSKVRSGLKRLKSISPGDFEMFEHPSPSAELKYKVMHLPPRFSVKGSDQQVHEHNIAYSFFSRTKKPKEKIILFALPVPGADDLRTINVILHKDHDFWKIEGAENTRQHFRSLFPQLDMDNLISDQEMQEFAETRPGQFPTPQYSNKIYAQLNEDSNAISCVLIGDSAHAFPPDLGLGVNTAFEDLYILNQQLDDAESDLALAGRTFEERRLPENMALVKMVQKTFPYQYNHVPWRLKAWMVKFTIQLGLNKISGGLIPEPGFLLTQRHKMNFVEMNARREKSDIAFYVFCTALFSLLIYVLI